MKKLKKVGYFIELSYANNNGPSLKKLVGKFGSENIEKVIGYLESGKYLAMSPELTEDILNDGKVIDTLNIRTDGVWSWPGDLAYYLGKYKVGLPEEFIQHMIDVNWCIPYFDIEEVEVDE